MNHIITKIDNLSTHRDPVLLTKPACVKFANHRIVRPINNDLKLIAKTMFNAIFSLSNKIENLDLLCS